MHAFANPARFLRIARPRTPVLLLSGLALTGAALVYGLFLAPAERLQCETVRILFIHVPTAWLGMAGWSAIAIASLVELVWRHPLAALAARASALPGAVFTFLCLASGSIWGRPATRWRGRRARRAGDARPARPGWRSRSRSIRPCRATRWARG